MRAPTIRSGDDRCPGLAAPFVSGDGSIVRVRVPGGRISTAALSAFSRVAEQHGDAHLTLTSRGAVQLRGLPDPLPEPVVAELLATGLFPSASHERARNVLADPCDTVASDVVDRYDALLLADPALAGLPARFLVGVAGRRRWVLGEPLDVAWMPEEIRVAGRRAACPADQAAEALVAVARAFMQVRGGDRTVWTMADLSDDAVTQLLSLLSGTLELSPVDDSADAPTPPAPGVHGTDDLLVGIPLGLLSPAHVSALADAADEVWVTPWRSVALPGGARYAEPLASVGLLVEPSAATRVSACVGAPSCHRGVTPTIPFVRDALPHLPAAGPRLHVVGCERGCGRPARDHVLVVEPGGPGDVLAAASGTAYLREGNHP